MTLLFGLSEHFERLPGVPDRELYEQRFALVQRAEEHGFYGYHVSEHHNGPLCMTPSPLVFLSALAQRTSTIRLGTLILILPLHEPLRLLEEICMADHLSGGRLMLGVGRGVRDVEHRWFDRDPAESRGRFAELVEVLRQGLAEGRLSHRGAHYRFDDLELTFRPLQRPHPPLWIAGNLEAAATQGMSVLGAPGQGMTRASIDRYWELYDEWALRTPPALTETAPIVGSTRNVVVAETDAEAQAIARRAWPAHADNVWRVPFDINGAPAVRGTAGMNVGEDADLVLGRRQTLVAGSPETVRDALAGFMAEAGPGHTYLVSSFQWGDITHDEACRSLDLYATDVIPALAALGAAAPFETAIK